MRRGTIGLLTTIAPSAASVGARRVATITASMTVIPGSRSIATIVPATIVSGSPMTSRRIGIPAVLRKAPMSIRAASTTRARISASSPATPSSSVSTIVSGVPRTAMPRTTPIASMRIWAVMLTRSRSREKSA